MSLSLTFFIFFCFSDYHSARMTDAYSIAGTLPLGIGHTVSPYDAYPTSQSGIFLGGTINGLWRGGSSGQQGWVYPYPECFSIFFGSRLSK